MVPPLGQLASLTDAENQTTSYTYDARGLKLAETYPDHTGGSTVGQTGYGIVTFVYDNAGRVLRKQDQLGVTLTHSYDLAGRMTRRDYRTAANSPSGTIADSNTFTFDPTLLRATHEWHCTADVICFTQRSYLPC
jgi:YD repeat-containing protein